MKIWTTQDGKDINVKDMTTPHIHNCIRMLETAIKEGRTTQITGGMGFDNDDTWYDEEDITPEIKNWIKTFKKELKQRHEPEEYVI